MRATRLHPGLRQQPVISNRNMHINFNGRSHPRCRTKRKLLRRCRLSQSQKLSRSKRELPTPSSSKSLRRSRLPSQYQRQQKTKITRTKLRAISLAERHFSSSSSEIGTNSSDCFFPIHFQKLAAISGIAPWKAVHF